MVFEYALEPELVSTWYERARYRFFEDKFGLGTGRLISRFPKHWPRLVWERFAGGSDLDKTRMVEVLTRLKEHMIRRYGYTWDPGRPWVANAIDEHTRQPFHAVVARDCPAGATCVLRDEEIGADGPASWLAPRTAVVRRTARDMARCVGPLLRLSDHVLFVDPHFDPTEPRWRRPLEAFLEELVAVRLDPGDIIVEVHLEASDVSALAEFFQRECGRRLPAIIPAGLKVRLVRWERLPEGDRLHNRYILTDRGGVSFGIGLDDAGNHETDDVILFERAAFTHRWAQYAGPNPAFHPVDRVEVTGRKPR